MADKWTGGYGRKHWTAEIGLARLSVEPHSSMGGAWRWCVAVVGGGDPVTGLSSYLAEAQAAAETAAAKMSAPAERPPQDEPVAG